MSTVFEEKSVSKAVIRIGLPAMLGQLTTLIYNLADTYFVALTKSSEQIAAVTLCVPVLLIIMSIACIFGMGGSSVIARLLGENEKEKASTVFNFCTFGMAISGAVVLVLGLLILTPIAHLIGADETNLAYTCDYLKWIFIGTPFIMIANGFVHTFRSVGLIKQATIGLALGNGINILFDWVFIVLLGWGTAGAAIATSFGFLCATIYYLIVLLVHQKKAGRIVNLSLKSYKPYQGMVPSVIQIGIPGALITVLMSISNIVLNKHIAIYGSNAVASYGIAYKIQLFPIMLSVGLSQGVAPLLGYYYGAREEKRLSKAMYYGTLYGVILGAVFGLIIFFGSRMFASIFLFEPELIAQASYFLKVLCISGPLLGIINMVSAYFQALGKAINSLIVTVLRNIVLFIPCVILLNKFWQLDGVIASQPVTEVILMIVCIFMYIFGAKKIKAEFKAENN